MKNWEAKAQYYLEKSLNLLLQEMNELDWKSGLSDKSEKLAHHLSAFANQSDGGFIVFGINNGTLCLRCGERLYSQETVRRFEEIRAKLEHQDTANF